MRSPSKVARRGPTDPRIPPKALPVPTMLRRPVRVGMRRVRIAATNVVTVWRGTVSSEAALTALMAVSIWLVTSSIRGVTVAVVAVSLVSAASLATGEPKPFLRLVKASTIDGEASALGATATTGAAMGEADVNALNARVAKMEIVAKEYIFKCLVGGGNELV